MIKVENMMCNHCVNRINKIIIELGYTAQIDLETKTINLNEPNKEEEVIEKLIAVGYQAKKD